MTSSGTVRDWHSYDGWGVIDSDATPGGCWAHYSAAAVDGYRSFTAGQPVWLEWEAADQDGYGFRATRFWPQGAEPATPNDIAQESSGAYRSTLTLTFDTDGDDG